MQEHGNSLPFHWTPLSATQFCSGCSCGILSDTRQTKIRAYAATMTIPSENFFRRSGQQLLQRWNLLTVVCVLLLLTGCKPASHASSLLDTAELAHLAAADPGNYGKAVRITGVVTYCDPQWHLLFVQDPSGGLFVDLEDEAADLRVGQLVELSGTLAPSNRGIDNLQSRILGTAPLPPAQSLPDDAETPSQRLSQWVKLQGTVRAASLEDGRLTLTVLDGTSRTRVRILRPGQVRPINFVGTHVQVEGVSATAEDKNGKPTGIQVFVSAQDQIHFLGGRKLTNPFSDNLEPISTALDRHAVGDLVHFSGIVLEQKADRILLVRRGLTTVVTRLADYSRLAPGDSVDLLGFISESSAFQIEDAIVRLTAPRTPLDESQITGALRTIGELKSLSTHVAAKGLPVDVQGTVTYVDPSLSLLFVQDATAGVYVDIHNGSAEVAAGDFVRVTGLSGPGDYAPIIMRPTITRLGRSPMPKPLTLSLQTLVSGNNDAGWVEFVGVVHSVSQLNSQHSFKLAVAGNKFDVQLPQSANIDAIREGLLDAQVRIDGVSGAVFNEKRQLVGIKYFVPSVTHIQIIEPPPAEAARVRSIITLLRFDPLNLSIHRTTVRGIVTLRDNERAFYTQDATAGIYVVAERKTSVRIGQYVEASGFGVSGPDGPYLEDAIVRVVDGTSHVTPLKLTADDLATGQYNSQLVTVQGRLLERVDGPDDDTLILQVGALVLRARLQGGKISARMHRDSVLEVGGILQSGGRPGRSDLRIALPSPGDVRVIAPAPWWTWENVAQILTVAIIAILAALLWVSVKVYRLRSYQATYDSLTGLLNRRATLEYLEREIGRAMRDRSPLAVVLADVDHFKKINDTYGHHVGDAVLRRTAEIFKVALRPDDAVGRYGGEEFLIVMRNCDDAVAIDIAERIRTCIRQEGFCGATSNTHPFQVTCSFGITIASGSPVNIEYVLASADRALYAAKNSGRNKVVMAESNPFELEHLSREAS